MSLQVVDWNDGAIETLRLGVAEGLSFSQVAKRVAQGCTRCAAIGKANRMGFNQPARASQPRRVQPANHRPSAPRPLSALARPAESEKPCYIKPLAGVGKNHCTNENIDPTWAGAVEPARTPFERSAPPPAGEPRAPRVVIPFREEPAGSCNVMTIGAHQCRWPIGEPTSDDFTFCGAFTLEGPYCAAHRQRAFTSEAVRKWVDRKLAMPARARFS